MSCIDKLPRDVQWHPSGSGHRIGRLWPSLAAWRAGAPLPYKRPPCSCAGGLVPAVDGLPSLLSEPPKTLSALAVVLEALRHRDWTVPV